MRNEYGVSDWIDVGMDFGSVQILFYFLEKMKVSEVFVNWMNVFKVQYCLVWLSKFKIDLPSCQPKQHFGQKVSSIIVLVFPNSTQYVFHSEYVFTTLKLILVSGILTIDLIRTWKTRYGNECVTSHPCGPENPRKRNVLVRLHKQITAWKSTFQNRTSYMNNLSKGICTIFLLRQIEFSIIFTNFSSPPFEIYKLKTILYLSTCWYWIVNFAIFH